MEFNFGQEKTNRKLIEKRIPTSTPKDTRSNYTCVYKGEDKDGKEREFYREVYAKDIAHAFRLGMVYGNVQAVLV